MTLSTHKLRIIGVVLVRRGWVVQSIGFRRFLPVGRPEIAVEYLNRWGIDEIVLLDIEATRSHRPPNIELVRRCAGLIQVPLAVGGGISSIKDVEDLVRGGADKVVINHAASRNPKLISDVAHHFGRQCVIVSVDVKRCYGQYEVYTLNGLQRHELTVDDYVQRCCDYGAGEIFLNSIDRDGSRRGFDVELAQRVVAKVDIPVVLCGGAGHPRHFEEASRIGVSGLAAANMLHYTEHSVIVIKRYLVNVGIPVRLDTYTDYEGFMLDCFGRIARPSDDYLDHIRFQYIPEEAI